MKTYTEKSELQEERYRVLIVGGGLAGLSTSLFLSWYGIPSLLIECHSGISPRGRASSFNARTLELFSIVGVEPLIRRFELPSTQHNNILRVEALAGKELGSFTQGVQEDLGTISPTRGCIIAQSMLEPILWAWSEKLGADIRFHTELVSFQQDAGEVSALIRDRETSHERIVHAHYLVAADGYKSSIRRQLDIPLSGPGILAHHIGITFRADLSKAMRERHIDTCILENPNVQGILTVSPDAHAGKLLSRYQPQKNEAPDDFTEKRCIELVHAAVGIPDLAVTILDISSWKLAAHVAERYRQEGVFLVGDAAHVMPPTGGLGANTGIQDAYNLAWKLAYVLKGMADPELLATYEVERRSIAQVTVEQACLRYAEIFLSQLPMSHSQPPIDLKTVVFGYRYHSAAICLESQDDGVLFENPNSPSGQPGTRAPHIPLAREGERISILSLFGRDFVLFIGRDGGRWQVAAKRVAEKLKVDLKIYSIDADLLDVDDNWYDAYQVTPTGAVLVRPDGFIGWRSYEGNEQPEQALEQALMTLLART